MDNPIKAYYNEGITKASLDVFRHNLVFIRQFFGWKQKDLAEALGLSRATISGMENYDNRLLKVHFLAILYILMLELSDADEETITIIVRMLSEKVYSIGPAQIVFFKEPEENNDAQ